MFGWRPVIALVNARVHTPEGEARSLRVRRRVLSIDEPPQRGDVVVDLDGAFVLPGLINAHDHLELNHYGRLKGRDVYGHASEWIDDLRPVIRSNQAVVDASRAPLADRLFIGGLKNLLAGVTTVAHHNPLYRAFGLHFPVRVVERFGWAHSLGMEAGKVGAHGEPGGNVAERARATPLTQPFIVHVAEGVDAEAAAELESLEAIGALRTHTVLVHGLAITPAQWHALFARGVSLVWCPASNQFLFGRTLCMPRVLESPLAAQRVCLGSDSRVTGSRDLLDEVRVGAESGVDAEALLRMVSTAAADVLRCDDAGRIRVGASADLAVFRGDGSTAAEAVLRAQRRDVQLVMKRGTPMWGTPRLAGAFAGRCMHVRRVTVDGVDAVMQSGLATRIERCTVKEPGVEVRER